MCNCAYDHVYSSYCAGNRNHHKRNGLIFHLKVFVRDVATADIIVSVKEHEK